MAIEPKTPRKRAVKKATAKVEIPVVQDAEVKKATRKKAAAVPVPVFQAAAQMPATQLPAAQSKPRKKAAVKATVKKRLLRVSQRLNQ